MSDTHATYIYYKKYYVHEGHYGPRTELDVKLRFKVTRDLAKERGFEIPSEIRVYDFESDMMTNYWPNGSKRESKLNGRRPIK
jgi:hypothetical protein